MRPPASHGARLVRRRRAVATSGRGEKRLYRSEEGGSGSGQKPGAPHASWFFGDAYGCSRGPVAAPAAERERGERRWRGREPRPEWPRAPTCCAGRTWGDVEARVGAPLQPEAWAAVRTAALRGGEARGAKGRCQGLGAARPGRRRLLSGRASELSGIPGAVRVTAQGEGGLRLVPGSPGGKMEATTKMAAHVKLDPTQHPHLGSSQPFHREPDSWVQHPQGFSTLGLGHHGGVPVTHPPQVWILPLVPLYPRGSVEFSFVGS
uniref:uncharacterized protein LOC113180415 n=1 Tax=Urocitellus parryii TaxID=9999 RepID=UPI000E5606D7|nr:uncharacterized protein LOC113180415 [Urocitellus parryii]